MLLSAQKNLGPILSILGLFFGPKLLIHARILVPTRVTNWLPKFDGILFSALGPIQGHKVQHLLVTWGRLKRSFLFSAWTSSVKKPLGLISTFAPIGMLNLG
jgi:hypothetical protein